MKFKKKKTKKTKNQKENKKEKKKTKHHTNMNKGLTMKNVGCNVKNERA